MRATPLCVWAANLKDPKDLYNAHKADAEFVHPNEIVHNAIFLYSIAIQYLLNNPTDPDRAQKAFDIAMQ